MGQLYGMAEGFFSMTSLSAPRAARRYSVGAPSPLDEVVVLAPGTETEVPDGQSGELCVRGPYTISGYFDARPAEEAEETVAHNARAFTSQGFYRTGDLGKLNGTGLNIGNAPRVTEDAHPVAIDSGLAAGRDAQDHAPHKACRLPIEHIPLDRT